MKNVLRLSLLIFVATAAFLAGADRFHTCAQDGTGVGREKCDCDTIATAACSGSYTPPPPPKRLPPLPPVKVPPIRSVYIGAAPAISDKDLVGLDDGTGTAANTPANVAKGENAQDVYRNPDGTISKNGLYPERRRAVYNEYLKDKDRYEESVDTIRSQTPDKDARANAIAEKGKEWKKTQDETRKELERINEQEREAYQKENAAEFEKYQKAFKDIAAQNELRTNAIIQEIGDLVPERFAEELQAAVEQVISENLAEARALELLGRDGSEASARARRILEKLYQKFAKDCEKRRLSTGLVAMLERVSQLAGREVGDLFQCISKTAVAQINAGGIEYTARKCLRAGAKGKERFEGLWILTISGLMSGTGTIEVKLVNGGKWESTAFVAGGTITQDGPAELISGGGNCAIKITAQGATGNIEGYRVRMPGVSGMLPIKILDETCTVNDGPAN